MTETDFATSGSDDAFTPEEQAAFDAYASGGEPTPSPEPAAPAPGAPEPAAAAAPGEVVDPDEEGAEDAEANKGRFVRHGAFHKERVQRKEAQRALAELQERFARGDERLRMLTQAMQAAPQAPAAPAQPAPEPEKAPDPNEDIFGYVQHLEKQLAEVRNGHKEMTEAQKQQAEQARAAEEERTIVGAYRQDIERYAAAEPAFGDAYTYLVQGRVAELKLYGLTDQQAVAQANADELAFVRSAVQRGVSPAEQAFALAKARGFVPKAPEPAAAPAAPAETPAERQARLAAGQATAKSLSAASGGPAGEVTMEMLASMSESDFEAFVAKNPAKARALMGG